MSTSTKIKTITESLSSKISKLESSIPSKLEPFLTVDDIQIDPSRIDHTPVEPTPIPFRSKETPVCCGEYYHDRDGNMYKLICRTAMYDNPEEHYIMLQQIINGCQVCDLPILVLEDDFKAGIMFETCNRFMY